MKRYIIKKRANENSLSQEAFMRGLRKIDESGLNRIMSHGKYGFIIISANRSEIYSRNEDNDLTLEYKKWCDSMNKRFDSEKNMKLWLKKRNIEEDEKLLDELKASKFAYSPVFGGYKGTDNVTDKFEPSYIVYCHLKRKCDEYLDFNELYEFALYLTRKYKQDSVYIQKPYEAPIYVNGYGEKINKKESKKFIFNDYTQEYFTTTKRKGRMTHDYLDKNGNPTLDTPPQRFTADIQFESLYRMAGPSTYFDRIRRSKSGEVFLDD